MPRSPLSSNAWTRCDRPGSRGEKGGARPVKEDMEDDSGNGLDQEEVRLHVEVQGTSMCFFLKGVGGLFDTGECPKVFQLDMLG